MIPRKEKKLTSQEKSDRGLPLSGNDITELLKDPNHWLSKLYAECLQEAALRRADFIRFVEANMCELNLAKQHEGATEQATPAQQAAFRRDMAAIAEQREPMHDMVKADKLSPMTVNKVQLMSLLNLSQNGMTLAELETHNQQIIELAHKQILAQMPKKLTVMFQPDDSSPAKVIEFDFSKVISSAAPPINRMYKVNSGLAQNMADSSEEVQKSFVSNYTEQQLYGPMSVIKTFRDTLEAFKEQFDPYDIADVGLSKLMPLVRELDAAAIHCRNANVPLLEHLKKNNDLLFSNFINQLIKENTVSLAEPPALFAQNPMVAALKDTPKPKPGMGKGKAEEQEEWWKVDYQNKKNGGR